MNKKIIYLNYFWVVILLMSGYVVSLKGVQPELLWIDEKISDQQSIIKSSFQIQAIINNCSNIHDISVLSSINHKSFETSEHHNPYYNWPFLKRNNLTSKEIELFIQKFGVEQLLSQLL